MKTPKAHTCEKQRMSKLGAKIALAELQAKDKGQKRIYYCPPCKAWHTTSKSEWRPGRRRQ